MARFRLFALPLLLVGTLPVPLAKALEMHADVNRRDGLVDRVLAVQDADGPALLVFEDPGEQGMLEPERVPLPAPATSLAAGRFDEDVFVDILAICGDALVVLHGRDRMLTLSERDVAAPVLSVIPLDEEVDASLAKRKISFAEIPASGAPAPRSPDRACPCRNRRFEPVRGGPRQPGRRRRAVAIGEREKKGTRGGQAPFREARGARIHGT